MGTCNDTEQYSRVAYVPAPHVKRASLLPWIGIGIAVAHAAWHAAPVVYMLLTLE